MSPSTAWPLTSSNGFLLSDDRSSRPSKQNDRKRSSMQHIPPPQLYERARQLSTSPYDWLHSSDRTTSVRSEEKHILPSDRNDNEGPIIAELKTNAMVSDEGVVIKQLSFLLAAQFTRKEASVLVDVNQNACLAMGGSFDSCYILTLSISGFDSSMVKSGSFIQSFVGNILGASPARGLILFRQMDLSGTSMVAVLSDNALYNQTHPPSHRPAPSPSSQDIEDARRQSLARLNGEPTPEHHVRPADSTERPGKLRAGVPDNNNAGELHAITADAIPMEHGARIVLGTQSLARDHQSDTPVKSPISSKSFDDKRRRRQSLNAPISMPWRHHAMRSELTLAPASQHSPIAPSRRLSQPDVSQLAAGFPQQPHQLVESGPLRLNHGSTSTTDSKLKESIVPDTAPTREAPEVPAAQPKKSMRRKSFVKAFKLAAIATGG